MAERYTDEVFELRLAAMIRDFGEVAVVPFDAGPLARTAMGAAEPGRERWTLRLDPRLMAVGLLTALILAIGFAAVGGPATDRPVPPSAAPHPAAAISPSPTTAPLSTPEPLGGTFSIAGEDLAFGPDGVLYVTACWAGLVMAIDDAGVARRVAGGSKSADAPFGDGGPATEARLDCPASIAFDAEGRLLVSDAWHNRIRRIGADGVIETIAGLASSPTLGGGAFGGDGGFANSASLNQPNGLAVGADGTVYFADQGNGRVRAITPHRTIETVAGNGSNAFGGDGGPAMWASISYPSQVVLDSTGNLYISDLGNDRVRRVAPDGTISTVLGGDTDSPVRAPADLAVDAAGALYLAEINGNRIVRLDPDGKVSVVAGTGEAGTSGVGGPAVDARMGGPVSIAIGPDGGLYSLGLDGRILRIDLETGILTGVAGGEGGVTIP
jgi:sugar lactone lactonase YvrE